MIKDLNVCNQSQIFNSQTMSSFWDDSRLQFPSSKRFTRKKQPYNQQNRNNKSSFNDENQLNCSIQKRTYTEQSKKNSGIANTFLKTEDLLLKITLTPNKNRMIIPQLSSDRSDSTVSKQRCEKQSPGIVRENIQTSKKTRIQELQAELQAKSSEIQKLTNQNSSLKQRLQQNQDRLQKQKDRMKRQYELTLRQLDGHIISLKQQLRAKSEELSAKNQQVKNNKKTELQLVREIKLSKYDKILLQKQIEELYKAKVSKQTREIMSFRQISLTAQIQELKKRLQNSKSHNEQHLQAEIRALREEACNCSEKYRNIEIHSRLLQRKINEYQKQLKERSVLFTRSYSKIKDSNAELNEQIKKMRKENIKLKQLLVLGSKCKNVLSISPSQTPLSLSSCSSLSSFKQ